MSNYLTVAWVRRALLGAVDGLPVSPAAQITHVMNEGHDGGFLGRVSDKRHEVGAGASPLRARL